MSIEERIRDALSRRAAQERPSENAWPAIQDRLRRHRWRTTVSGVLVASLTVGGFAAGLYWLWGKFQAVEIPRTSQADVAQSGTAEISVGGFPSAAAVGEGRVWVVVQMPDRSPDHWLLRVDSETNEVLGMTPLGSSGADVTIDAGTVWVLSYEDETGSVLLRVDAQAGAVTERIPLQCRGSCGATSVAAEGASVWVTLESASRSGELVRIDPASNQIDARIPVEGWPREVAIGEDAVWVFAITHFGQATVEGASLLKVDAQTNRIIETLFPGELVPASGNRSPDALAVGSNALWIPGKDESGEARTRVLRINPATNEIVGSPVYVTGAFNPFGAVDGGVWFWNGGRISHIDARTMDVDASIRLEAPAVDAVIDLQQNAIWVVNYKNTVTRIPLP
jgi:DNA-binding beta-propeller fold protein YncE